MRLLLVEARQLFGRLIIGAKKNFLMPLSECLKNMRGEDGFEEDYKTH